MLQQNTTPIRLNRHQLSFRILVRAIPLLALVFVLSAVAPLHAQQRASIHKIPPVYPPIARQMGITGTIVVNVTVDASGKVIKAESSSGNKLLSSSAIDAVKQWKFAPAESTDTFPININFEKN